jgi:hypothetical protein
LTSSTSQPPASHHPLLQRVELVSQRSRRLLLWYAVATFIAIVLPAAVVLGLLDYLLRIDDEGVRLICSSLLLTVAGWAFWRFVLAAARAKFSLLLTARAVERRFPNLRDQLSSAIAFLHRDQDDAYAGSADLRRVVIDEATKSAAGLDLKECLDASAPRRSTLAVLFGAAVLCMLFAFQPTASQLAARRLLLPWDRTSWPRWNSLTFASAPDRVARGADFEVELIDQNRHLPDAVDLHVWFEGEPVASAEVRPMKRVGQRMLGHLANVSRSFQVRASGGDDDSMPWLPVDVVDPPRVDELKVLVVPPAYTNLPEREAGNRLQALEGSILEVRGRVNKPLGVISLQTSLSEAEYLEPRISADGNHFSVVGTDERPFIASESGSIEFFLTDRHGIENQEAILVELQVVPDMPPVVTLESPSHGAFFTPRAVVDMSVLVKDDLAIDDLELLSADQFIPLKAASRAADPSTTTRRRAVRSQDVVDGSGESWLVEYEWDLAAFELEPGDALDFELVARDFKPQSGSSDVKRITIVSLGELARRFDQRRFQIQRQFRELIRTQRSVREQVRFLEIQIDETGELTRDETDYLQAAELNQRHVRERLEEAPDGLMTQIDDLLTDVASNRLDNAQAAKGMERLRQGLRDVSDGVLRPLENDLLDVLKDGQQLADHKRNTSTEKIDLLKNDLGRVKQQQETAINQFEAILASLERWDNFHRFARELSELIQQQETIAAATREAPTFGQELRSLSPRQRAEMKKTAERQRGVARRLDQLQQQMSEAGTAMRDEQPRASAAALESLAIARQSAVAGRLRQAAQSIAQNKLGVAESAQEQVAAALEEMMSALTGTADLAGGRAIEQLRQAADNLQSMQDRQRQVESEIANEQTTNLAEVGQRQRQLATETNQLARRLDRLCSESTSATRTAGGAMQRAAESLQSDARQQAAESATQAEQQLAEAQQALADEIQRIERQLAAGRDQQLFQRVTVLLQGQQAAAIATRAELDGESTAAFGFEVQADSQRVLARKTSELVDAFREQRAITFLLESVRKLMEEAAQMLEQHGELERVEARQVAAAARLAMLLESLTASSQSDDDSAGESPAANDTPDPDENSNERPRGPSLVELRLLRELQRDINQRTDAIRGADPAGDFLKNELQTLATEQQQLADVILRPLKESE